LTPFNTPFHERPSAWARSARLGWIRSKAASCSLGGTASPARSVSLPGRADHAGLRPGAALTRSRATRRVSQSPDLYCALVAWPDEHLGADPWRIVSGRPGIGRCGTASSC